MITRESYRLFYIRGLFIGFVGLVFGQGIGCGPAIPLAPEAPTESPKKESIQHRSQIPLVDSPAKRLGLKVMTAERKGEASIHSALSFKMDVGQNQIAIRGHLKISSTLSQKLLLGWSERAFDAPVIQVQVQHGILNGNNKWVHERPAPLATYSHHDKMWFVSVSELIEGVEFHETDTHFMVLDLLLDDGIRHQIEVRFRVKK